MRSKSLSNIEITDSDIDEVEQLMRFKFDKQRRDIIKCMDDLEVQALPGTGKTTVLIAKLAILFHKWPYSHDGICVLSHTNVAREEIEKRLGETEKSLLTYPHFIGTVNSFFDTFVTFPWLKSHGYKIRIIDTNTVVTNRYRNLSQSTKKYFEYNHLNKDACESESFPEPSFKSLKCNETSQSYCDVYNCVKQSMKDGYFTFDETLHIAEYVLNQNKFLLSAIQKRFPIILIDESQDTKNIQWELINRSFPKGSSVRQFFGDSNQAIYQSIEDDNTQQIMPKIEKQMTISNSYRFDERIAHLADPLGIISGLTGSSNSFKKLDNKHMIFLFDDATKVLPAYAEYLLSCFTDEELNGDLDCYAVGMVHNKKSLDYDNQKKYPMGVKDYYLSYDSNITNTSYMPQYLVEYFEKGKFGANQSNDLYPLVDNIAKGLRTFIISNTVLDVSSTGQAFNSLLKIIPEDKKDDFRFEFLKIVNLPIGTEKEWERVVLSVKLLLNHYFNIGIDNYDEEFFRWENIGDADEENREMSEQNSQKQNIYTFQKGNRTVNINLGSIHSVKGMTHLATLVLETYWYGKNIESLLPWLCGDINKNNSGKRILSRLRCHYVALTRASGLVCMAMSKHSVDEESRDRLTQNGWKITEL